MKILIKTVIMAGANVLIAVSAFANGSIASSNIPNQVLKQFDNQYPGIKTTKWSMNQGEFEATFEEKGDVITSIYNHKGEWQETVTRLKKVAELPAVIIAAYDKGTFKRYCVDDIKQVSTPAGTQYILNVDNHNGNWSITEGIGSMDDEQLKFTEDGLLIGTHDLNGPDEDDI